MSKYNILDLFSGCGGLLEGFEQTGKFKTLACIEWDKKPLINLEKRLLEKWNYSNVKDIVINFDLQKTEELLQGWNNHPEYGTHIGLNKLLLKDQVDLIIGGPPCQAYSIAGRIRDEHGMKNDYRNYLFESYVKLVEKFKPDFFVFENVTGIMSAKPNGIPITDEIKSAFKDIQYEVIEDFKGAIYDLSQYGIPQKRKRIIIFAVNKEKYGEISKEIVNSFYNDIMPKYLEKTVSVQDAIGDLPKLYPTTEYKNDGYKYSHKFLDEGINHVPRFHSERDIGVFRLLAKDLMDGSNEYKNSEKLKELYTSVTGKVSNVHKYHVLKSDLPSNTIPAHLYKDGLRHIHPDYKQARSITVREAARLQTFPDDYIFTTGRMSQYKMIGNAVPPKFAYKVAQATIELFIKYGK